MSTRLKHIPARLAGKAGQHPVTLRWTPSADDVELLVLRDSRRDAKQDARLTLTLADARDLQRALQGAIDEGYRRQAARAVARRWPADLREAVEQLATQLEEAT